MGITSSKTQQPIVTNGIKNNKKVKISKKLKQQNIKPIQSKSIKKNTQSIPSTSQPIQPIPPTQQLTQEQQQAINRENEYNIRVQQEQEMQLLQDQVNMSAQAGHIVPPDYIYKEQTRIRNIGKEKSSETKTYDSSLNGGISLSLDKPNQQNIPPPVDPNNLKPGQNKDGTYNPIVAPPKPTHHMRNFFILFIIVVVVVIFIITNQGDPVALQADQNAKDGVIQDDSNENTTKDKTNNKASTFVLSSAAILFVIGWGIAIYRWREHRKGNFNEEKDESTVNTPTEKMVNINRGFT